MAIAWKIIRILFLVLPWLMKSGRKPFAEIRNERRKNRDERRKNRGEY